MQQADSIHEKGMRNTFYTTKYEPKIREILQGMADNHKLKQMQVFTENFEVILIVL